MRLTGRILDRASSQAIANSSNCDYVFCGQRWSRAMLHSSIKVLNQGMEAGIGRLPMDNARDNIAAG